MEDAAVREAALQAAVLVLVFGYGDGDAAIEEVLSARGPVASADVAAVRADLASPAGRAAVEAYVAATFRDMGPTGVALADVGARLIERFGG